MSIIAYTCPNCRAKMIFDPSSQGCKCEYCNSYFTLEELENLNPLEESQEVQGTQEVSDSEGGAVLYTCPGCGAEIITDENTVATFCYYCHSPVVLEGRASGEFKPDFVVPFKIDRKSAEKIFADWVSKKKFVPKYFYEKSNIEKMQGVYFPYVLYNCNVNGHIFARAVKKHTSRSGNRETVYEDIYDVSRDGEVNIKNITRNALNKANKVLVEAVLPYQFDNTEKFSLAYLTGFLAEKRDLDINYFKNGINDEVRNYTIEVLRNTISGYSSVDVSSSDINIINEEWKYVLLPVWSITYNDKEKGKIYYFSINGQTGKVVGNLPVDNKKLFTVGLGVFAVITTILLFISYFII